MLIVHLEALGAVLRATSLLPALKRKYPNSHVTWVTQSPAQNLLANLPQIDRTLTTSETDLIQLKALKFDFAFCLDKSLKASGVLASTQYNNLKGFIARGDGVIVPANAAAEELWELGLSNYKKFFVNQKPETQLVIESLELGEYLQDPYQVVLSEEEKKWSLQRKKEWAANSEIIIGLNTGCSPIIPYKKLAINAHRELVLKLSKLEGVKVVLLGGPEDTERNALIAKDLDAVNSPTELGIRDGLASVAACDIVFSGDSLGMHMAIALQKYVVAWFGPTCAHEIELYGRGEKILTAANCSPCWLRTCHKSVMCYDQVNLDEIIQAIERGIHWQTSSSKQLILETFSSPSPL
ncbi:MAG: glycosyltransferase family 9 protein [Bdellovibrionales bacterium]|nr:glycosyltransferase family 9 protein [Bdellovibrionales bacterium]